MKRIPSVKTAMTPFPYSVSVEASVDEALAFMREHRIRHLPVTDDGDLAGMVSDRDIKLMLGPDFAYPSGSELTVGDAMVRDAYVVDLETRLDLVVEHMAEEHLGSAIVTRKDKLAGRVHRDRCLPCAGRNAAGAVAPGRWRQRGLTDKEANMNDITTANVTSLDCSEPIWERFFTLAPLVLIGTREPDGDIDIAPKHLAIPMSWDNYFGFVCTPRHATYANARRTGVFTVTYPRPGPDPVHEPGRVTPLR